MEEPGATMTRIVMPSGTDDRHSILLSRDNFSSLRDIVQTFDKKDVEIICRAEQGGDQASKVVMSSSLLLAISSPLLKSIFADLFATSMRLNEDKLVMYMPDFSRSALLGLQDLMKNGFAQTQSSQEHSELTDLMNLLLIPAIHCPRLCVIGQVEMSGSEVKVESFDVKIEDDNIYIEENDDYMFDLEHSGHHSSNNSTEQSSNPVPMDYAVPSTSSQANNHGQHSGGAAGSTTSQKTKQSSFACTNCGYDGGTLESCLSHIKELVNDPNYVITPVTESGTSNKCPVCTKELTGLSSFRKHVKAHVTEAHNKVTSCKITKCGEEHETVSEYFDHLKKHQQEYKNRKTSIMVVCEYCKNEIKSKSLYDHQKSCKRKHSNNYLQCDQCDFQTIHADSLNCHIAAKHNSEMRSFKCNTCNKSFFKKYRLDLHVKTHSSERSEVCNECGAAFLNIQKLGDHKRSVHKLKFKFECTDCSQKSKFMHDIIRHVLGHTDVTAYECTSCHERFKTRPLGLLHKKKVHNGEGNITLVNSEELENVKKTLIREIEPTD